MSLHIEGRRWFRRGPGNTYTTTRIFKDGELIAHLPMTGGYGDYYLQRAHEWLGQNGYPELAERHANGSPKVHTGIWLREVAKGTCSVIDVSRQGDL